MKAFKYRLYPTRIQAAEMQQQLDVGRELYNACLEERREAWKHRLSLNYYDQANQLKEIRRLRPDLATINYGALQAICRRAQRSYEAFYRRCKAGEKRGCPRFKGQDRFDSITFPEHGNGCKLTDRLYLQGVGRVKIKLHRPIEGRIKTATMKREGKRWFVIFVCESEAVPLPPTGRDAGVDMGLEHFLTLDDGEMVDNPRHLRCAEKRLRRAQRSLSRKRPGGRNRAKQRAKVAEQHRKIRNARRDFQQKEARKLVARFDAIYHEDLNIRGMVRNHHLAKSISDAGWGQFIGILRAKAAEAERVCIAVNPAGTSQACICGARVEKTLAQRWHTCPACGLSLPRDQVSAMLIKALGHRVLAQTQQDTAHVARVAVS